jgi:hypothetical protein
VGLEDVAVGEVEQGEQDQFVAGLDAVECVGEGGVDLELRLGCTFECLVGRAGARAQRRADDADRAQHVWVAFVHTV